MMSPSLFEGSPGTAGRTVGRYRLLDLLDRGSMGVVYRAYDPTLDRCVALKLLRTEGEDCRDRDRFLREARAAAGLAHPNVVTVYEAGEERGVRFFAMELVEGQLLSRILRSRRRLPEREALDAICQVLSALDAAHRAGLVHRDIKPDNLMVLPDGRVKVLDFGIVKLDREATLTRADEVVGTVTHMSPEQASGEVVGPASDLYAAGLVLYEMVAGRLPFADDSTALLLYQHLHEPPPPPSSFNPILSPELDDLVLRFLAKQPLQRYRSAGEAIAAVRSYLDRRRIDDLAAGSPPQTTPFSPKDGTPPLIGRLRELARLDAAVQRAVGGAGGTVFIEGEAGVGKTRLAQEAQARARQAGARTALGACYYRHGVVPYLPFIDALRDLLTSAMDEDERQEAKAWLRREAPELSSLSDRFGTTIGFSPEPRPQSGAAPEAARRLFEAMAGLLSRVASRRPLVLLLDDAHWADDATLRLLHVLSRTARNTGLLILVTYRPEDLLPEAKGLPHPLTETVRRMGREQGVEHIRLERLPRPDAACLVRSLLGAADFPEAFWDLLYAETQGNPLFLIETLKLLRAQNALSQRAGVWRVRAGASELRIPDRVRDLVLRRLDRLDFDQREVLQAAAVVGYRFTSDLLACALGLGRRPLLRALYRLERVHQLIVSSGGGYAFCHSRVREVLYQEIPDELRREYHRCIGHLLAERCQGRVDDAVEEIADHLLHAGEDAEAIPLLLTAGEKAERLCAWPEAARRFEQAAQAAGRAAPPDGERSWAALLKAGEARGMAGEWERALDLSRRALSASETPAKAARAWRQIGWARYQMRQFPEAMAAYRSGLERLRGAEQGEEEGRLFNNLAILHFEQGDTQEAEACYRRALDLFEASGDLKEMANVTNNLAILATLRGDIPEAKGRYDRAGDLYARVGNLRGQARVCQNVGMLHADQEEWEEADASYLRGLDLAERVRDGLLTATLLLNRAEASLRAAGLGPAREMCLQALDRFQAAGDSLGVADAFKTYGVICREEGDWDTATDCFERSISLHQEIGVPLGLAETLLESGILCRMRGASPEALDRLRRAERIFDDLGASGDLRRVREEIARIGTGDEVNHPNASLEGG